MTYAVKQDLIDRFGERELIQLTDRTNIPATAVDDTVVTKALSDATEFADTFLAKRYALPLNPVPGIMVKTVCDVARYYLHGDRAEKDSPVTRAYKDADNWLKQVSNGVVVLDADGVIAPGPKNGGVKVSGPDRVFNRDSLRDL